MILQNYQVFYQGQKIYKLDNKIKKAAMILAAFVLVRIAMYQRHLNFD
jgi:hypothetical protein